MPEKNTRELHPSSALQVYTCGVCSAVSREIVRQWNEDHKDFQAELSMGGSVDLARKVKEGVPVDVVILADESNFSELLMPEFVDKYTVFAANSMVIAANEGYEISDEDWIEKLTAPDATFAHRDPYGDPCGYRSVMAMLLADRVQPGLSKKLMEHPGHLGMDKKVSFKDLPPYKYEFVYGSGAELSGRSFAHLPAIMNQSDESLRSEYAKVSFKCDENTEVVCTPIAHAIAMPKAALHKKEAKEFIEKYLSFDFKAAGFVEERREVTA